MEEDFTPEDEDGEVQIKQRYRLPEGLDTIHSGFQMTTKDDRTDLMKGIRLYKNSDLLNRL